VPFPRLLAIMTRGPSSLLQLPPLCFNREEFGTVDMVIAPFITRGFILEEHRRYKGQDVNDKWKQYANVGIDEIQYKLLSVFSVLI